VVRQPALAGRFYPDKPDVLRSEVRSYILSDNAATAALGCIVPHAGYMYSGHIAGAVYSQLKIPNHCIVMSPNHTGRGEPLAIMSSGEWKTPLGNVPIYSALASALKQNFPLLSEDAEAHRFEHAAEVHLPFLQTLNLGVSFVPIALGTSQSKF
jgi:AmmeMemoRadiSam system protein B